MRSQKCIIKKDANNETEYEEYLVTNKVLSCFNIFKCGRKILNILGVVYEQAYMDTTKDKSYTKMLEMLVDYNDRNNVPLSNERILQVVSRVMAET